MGRAYRETHPGEPYDLSDPAGIVSELVDEAIQDAKDATLETTSAIERTAKAAYDRPVDFVEYALKGTRRFARERPLDTLALAASIAFIFGRLIIGRRSTVSSNPATEK
jgi:ElaB/YqjD/DUF883 family membrane-anchored ribosome-binding protein